MLTTAFSRYLICSFALVGKMMSSIMPVGLRKLVQSSVSSQSKMITDWCVFGFSDGVSHTLLYVSLRRKLFRISSPDFEMKSSRYSSTSSETNVSSSFSPSFSSSVSG